MPYNETNLIFELKFIPMMNMTNPFQALAHSGFAEDVHSENQSKYRQYKLDDNCLFRLNFNKVPGLRKNFPFRIH
jgi:hypothetical protein